ncbi:GNAT family N-acetyltransferase [Novacetimonas pomaceti]|uniref:N-acetyltransferase domain-containing protein n=1 Tax=Novacetimonas pomaceti TaxID=2021998 RepID=A0A318QG56_9PROT|nr:GNAT family N-acetyltransferase [Novacetimonas pomaceti]PYD76451.1 hypothetical protein CFR71_02555 [Novacetimonas pomaceti]
MAGTAAFAIRPARPGDAVALPDVERSAARLFGAIPALAWLASGDVCDIETHAACIAQGTCWVGVDAKGGIAGFLSARATGDSLHIIELSVRQDAQGHGLGRGLLHAAMQWVRHAPQAAGRLTLTTFRDVPWNAPFYRKMGFGVMDQPPPELARMLAEEEAHGFPPGSRCAMQWRAGHEKTA